MAFSDAFRFKETVTATKEIRLKGGALYVGEWGAGVTLQELIDGSWTDLSEQGSSEFRAPANGRIRINHASDTEVKLRRACD